MCWVHPENGNSYRITWRMCVFKVFSSYSVNSLNSCFAVHKKLICIFVLILAVRLGVWYANCAYIKLVGWLTNKRKKAGRVLKYDNILNFGRREFWLVLLHHSSNLLSNEYWPGQLSNFRPIGYTTFRNRSYWGNDTKRKRRQLKINNNCPWIYVLKTFETDNMTSAEYLDGSS